MSEKANDDSYGEGLPGCRIVVPSCFGEGLPGCFGDNFDWQRAGVEECDFCQWGDECANGIEPCDFCDLRSKCKHDDEGEDLKYP